MNKTVLIFLIFINISIFGQEKIENLNYAKTEIRIPKKCVAKSEYEIFNCNGFSAQWIYLNDEMLKQKVDEQVFKQLEQNLKFKSKKPITFTSQNQKFSGIYYMINKNESKIVATGTINGIPLIVNLSFGKELTQNNDLNEFEKNFITLQ